MISIENKNVQIDYLLDRMAEAVQLDDMRYNRMQTSYEAVKNWIESDSAFFQPSRYDIYPHGSVRTLTTVKPIGQEEFDLDVVIQLKEGTTHTPQKVYDELKRRLSESSVYEKKVELKNRCVRLNYSGDFHMDIMPGIQESIADANKIKVPDRKLKDWVSSNPKGYANWFLTKADMVQTSLLELSMMAEKLPPDSFKHKKPLQRAVQLIKRYRDIYFQDDNTYKTSSIILTTIAGQYYKGEDSIFNTIDNVVSKISYNVKLPHRLKIVNPVNPDEDFTDKWDSEPLYYTKFKAFVSHLHEEWNNLKTENGVLAEGNTLKGLFGNDVFMNAQKQQSALLEGLRANRSLRTIRDTGIITSVAVPKSIQVKHNTFFGK